MLWLLPLLFAGFARLCRRLRLTAVCEGRDGSLSPFANTLLIKVYREKHPRHEWRLINI